MGDRSTRSVSRPAIARSACASARTSYDAMGWTARPAPMPACGTAHIPLHRSAIRHKTATQLCTVATRPWLAPLPCSPRPGADCFQSRRNRARPGGTERRRVGGPASREVPDLQTPCATKSSMKSLRPLNRLAERSHKRSRERKRAGMCRAPVRKARSLTLAALLCGRS